MKREHIALKLKLYKPFYLIYVNLLPIYYSIFFIFFIYLCYAYRTTYVRSVGESPYIYDKVLCGIGSISAIFNGIMYGFIVFIILLINELLLLAPLYQKYLYYRNLSLKDTSNYNHHHYSSANNNINNEYINPEFLSAMAVFGFQKGDDITLDKINKKRRELMRLHHPDAGGSLEMSQTINAAYDYLCSKI